MENLLKQIEILREKIISTWLLLDIDGKISKLRDLKREISKPNFWNDQNNAIKVSKMPKK